MWPSVFMALRRIIYDPLTLQDIVVFKGRAREPWKVLSENETNELTMCCGRTNECRSEIGADDRCKTLFGEWRIDCVVHKI